MRLEYAACDILSRQTGSNLAGFSWLPFVHSDPIPTSLFLPEAPLRRARHK